MSAPLAAFKPELDRCGAVYANGLLKVILTGQTPGGELEPWIVRDHWAGGVHLSLLAHWAGYGPQQPKTVTIPEFETHILLPMRGFNNGSVLVKTADETFKVEIKYLGYDPKGSKEPEEASESPHMGIVLPPTRLDLPGGRPGTTFVTADAPVPPPGFTVLLQYKREFLRIWETQITDKKISWVLTWEKDPKDFKNPEIFTVKTVTYELLGTPPLDTHFKPGTSHSYLVYPVLLGDPQAKVSSRG